MDISPLFVLRQRLHAAALAGAASCSGDARLAQACEALAPLEAAAPVFRKLGDLVRRLRASEGEGRAAVLLEALTLADALACTQAAVAVPGEVGPVEPAGQGGEVADVPYSVVASFRKDMVTARKSSPERLWASPELRPEFFREYRLYGFLRQGLAAQGGYAKDMVEWLGAKGEDILPLLAEGFDPDGGKEMVWRVHMLDKALAGAANDFYCAQLDRSGSAAVRAELIYALRHRKENAARLLELCRTEKGKLAAMARWVLARMDDPAAWAYFRALLPKQPRQVMAALEFACGGQEAGELVAQELERLLAPLVADAACTPSEKEVQDIQQAFYALPGKTGPAVCEAYRRMAALGTTLDDRLRLRHKFTDRGPDREGSVFCTAVALTLREAILRQSDEGLLALAEELMRTASFLFVIPYLTGMLLLRPAAEAYEAAKRLLAPYGFARSKLKKKGSQILHDVFMEIEVSYPRHELANCQVTPLYGEKGYYDLDGVFRPITAETWIEHLERRGCRGFRPAWSSDVTKRRVVGFRPFAEPLDFRWLEALTASGKSLPADGMWVLAFLLLDLGDPQHCERMARIFASWMERTDDWRISYRIPSWLACCGKRDMRGLLEKFFRQHGIDESNIEDMARGMRYIAPEIFLEEMEACLDLLRRGELRLKYRSEEQTIYANAENVLDEFRRFLAARSRKAASDRA